MIVTVVDRARQRELWGSPGYRSIMQVIRTVEISDHCPRCGGPRGEPVTRRYCEDGEYYDVSNWTNACGHLDMYAAVIQEATAIERLPEPSAERRALDAWEHSTGLKSGY